METTPAMLMMHPSLARTVSITEAQNQVYQIHLVFEGVLTSQIGADILRPDEKRDLVVQLEVLGTRNCA